MSEARLRELFSLTPIQQARHWASNDPWEKMRLENTVEISANGVLRDDACNITRMPLLMKPCFGQPLAFARHGGSQPILHPQLGALKSRCMRCKAQESCERVAKARLVSTPEIKNAFVRFSQAGGAYGLKNASVCTTARREFDGLVAVIVRHGGFSSSNDPAALAELARRDTERRSKDAKRQRTARRKAIKLGEFTPDFLAMMESERERREEQLILATSWEGLPRNVDRMPLQSARNTADVWFVRECMKIRGDAINPSSVARALIGHFPDLYDKTKYNSLRQRTGADLVRIATLERHVVKGFSNPIWPRFDLDSALDRLDAVTPYAGP